jgi:hypothetical protein
MAQPKGGKSISPYSLDGSTRAFLARKVGEAMKDEEEGLLFQVSYLSDTHDPVGALWRDYLQSQLCEKLIRRIDADSSGKPIRPHQARIRRDCVNYLVALKAKTGLIQNLVDDAYSRVSFVSLLRELGLQKDFPRLLKKEIFDLKQYIAGVNEDILQSIPEHLETLLKIVGHPFIVDLHKTMEVPNKNDS